MFINTPLCLHAPFTTTSRSERLITVTFLHPTSRPRHPSIPRLLGRRVTLRDFSIRLVLGDRGRSGHCMSARAYDLLSQAPLAVARHGSAWRGRLWTRKTVLRFEHARHTFQRLLDTVHPFTFPSGYSALAPRRASHAQPDDRVWPKSQRSSTVHHRRRRRRRLSSQYCPHLLAVLDVCSHSITDLTPTYALYALVHILRP